MEGDAFRLLGLGFLFEMIDFRIAGFDVLPDIFGFILFGKALAILGGKNEYFSRAKKLNPVLLILSVLHIYERPVQQSGTHVILSNLPALVLGIAIAIMELVHVYDVFMGIRELAQKAGNLAIAQEADSKWAQYLGLEIAIILGFIIAAIPSIGPLYLLGVLLGTIALAFSIRGYMERCGESLA